MAGATREGVKAMDFGEFAATENVNPAYRRIKELGLESHVFDIETYGFTVVPPEKVASREFFERVRETVLRIARDRTGVDLQLDRNGSAGKIETVARSRHQFLLFCLLSEDPIFEEWVLNPTFITLADYFMRGQYQLSNLGSFVKWKGGPESLGLHADGGTNQDGRMPSCGDVFNSVWALTDYSLEHGAIAMVPGSHKLCRLPVEGEGEDVAVPVEASEGSLILWHGNTWHGAYPKRTDGLRLNLTTYVCNKRLKPQEDFLANVTQEMLDRNPVEFAHLVGADDWMGWTDSQGPRYKYTRLNTPLGAIHKNVY